MNLRVDLMLDTERRSPSVLSVKFLVRLSAVVVPALVAVLIGTVMLGNIKDRGSVGEASEKWKGLQPKQKAAEKLRTELVRNEHVWRALEGWPTSRVEFSEHMLGLVQQVPEQIQLISVNVSHEIKPSEKTFGRYYAMALEGRSVGTNAEENIHLLVSRLKTAPPFAGKILNVTMRGRPDTAATATKTDRLFTISCAYGPKDFMP